MTCLHCQRRIWPNEARAIPGGKASDYLCPTCDALRTAGILRTRGPRAAAWAAPAAPAEVARNIAHARTDPEDDLPPGYGPGDNVPW